MVNEVGGMRRVHSFTGVHSAVGGIDRHLEAHATFLDKYYSSSQFIVSGRQNRRTGEVILVRDTLRNDLEELLTQDPFLQLGPAKHTIVEFTPTRHNPEFITV